MLRRCFGRLEPRLGQQLLRPQLPLLQTPLIPNHTRQLHNTANDQLRIPPSTSSFKGRHAVRGTLLTILASFLALPFLWTDERTRQWFWHHFQHIRPSAGELERPASETEEPSHDECNILADEDQPKRKKKKIGFRERRIIEYENRIRTYSSPDKIFRYFATLKVPHDDGNYEIFMTPEDFVRSLTPGVMQPRRYGLDKFKIFNPNEQIPYSTKRNIFYWMGRDGLINYTDYLFLMTLLSTSPGDITLAFYVYDINGDGHLDREEFDRVQELLLNQSNVGQKHRDHSTMNMSFRKGASSALVKFFFGADGKQKLDVDRFLAFQKELHRDILQIEFERRDPESMPVGIISEVAFADLLLIHAALPDKKRQKMLKRVRKAYKGVENRRGVSFDEVNAYFTFLYQIENVDMALHFYKLSGQPLSRDLLRKVAKRIANVELSDTVLDIVVRIFDENGDGLLSHREFISVMKKRMNRGLESPKDTGLFRFLDAILECSKKQLYSAIST